MKLRRSLLNKSEYNAIQTLLDTVEGWLSLDDAANLFILAKNVTGKGVIVEVGSWKGKSTICLAWGSKKGKNSRIFAIDPHSGSAEHTSNTNINTLPEFKKNIQNAKVSDIIIPIVKTSEEAAQDIKEPVELIFIDGAHDYTSVKKDFDLWYPKVINGGWMIFHDSVESTWPGVVKVVDTYVYKSNKFKNIRLIGVTTYAQKAESISARDKLNNYYLLMVKSLLRHVATIPFPPFFSSVAKKLLQYIQI